MYTIQLVKNGHTTEQHFTSRGAAVNRYEALRQQLAPNAERRTSVSDPDHIPQNAIRLMRGRFVEEWVEF